MSEETKVTVVQSVYDAINDVTANVAAGTIERILIKRINEDGSPRVTQFKDKNTGQQKSINNTHRYALLLKQGDDQAWISFGEGEVKNLKYENQFQIKGDDGYVDIKEGMAIRLPVVIKTFPRKDGTQGTSTEGKKNKIKITDASGARDSKPAGGAGGSQQASGATGAAGGKTTKVYGEILSVSGTDVVVKDEAGNEVTVKLTEEQTSQLVEGGRLAGQRGEDGSIIAGFKAYGPKGSAPAGGSRSGGKKDTSGMETGHALNGALNLRRSGLTVAPVVEVAKVVHDVTKDLKKEASQDPSNKGMSDYDIGAMVGHAVLNATRDIQVGDNDNPEEITNKLLEYSRDLLSSVVPPVAAYVKGESLAQAAQGQPEPKLEPKKEDAVKANDQGHIDMTPEELDFDDDIPF